uniref:Uncharacterized protein n=1 Tax=Zosterops lateralis melanops TaxID=1220523 RepID=A0A8D2P5V9_ZOSLA
NFGACFTCVFFLPGLNLNLALRRKLHRHSCSQRRCIPLHSRVPFP